MGTMGDDWKRLGQVIRQRRKSLVMSQAELAEAAGLGRSTIQKLEWGTASPERKTLAMIEKALKLREGSAAAVLAGGEAVALPEAARDSVQPADGDWVRGTSSQPDLVTVLDHIVLDLVVAVAPGMTVAEVKQLQARALETARRLGLRPTPGRLEAHSDDDPES